jgi:hypothetical protein
MGQARAGQGRAGGNVSTLAVRYDAALSSGALGDGRQCASVRDESLHCRKPGVSAKGALALRLCLCLCWPTPTFAVLPAASAEVRLKQSKTPRMLTSFICIATISTIICTAALRLHPIRNGLWSIEPAQ